MFENRSHQKTKIKINALLMRISISAIIAFLAYFAIQNSYGVYRADRISRSSQTVDSYQEALEYDDSNPTLWWSLGRLRHYSIEKADLPGAADNYRNALTRNPRLSQAWVDLADVYERQGKIYEAETALENAYTTQKYSPLILWQAGNFYLRRGNLHKMYENFKIASQYDQQKLSIALNIAWKIDPDHEGILQKLVPDNLPSNLEYLSFLISHDKLDLAAPVWQRCMKNEITDDFIFKASTAFSYIDHLLNQNRVSEAEQVWDDALRKSGLGSIRNRQKTKQYSPLMYQSNLLWNGSFERDLLKGGFDWRYNEIPGCRIRIDSVIRIDQLKSLRMTFDSFNNPSTCLSQIMLIPQPGSYIIDFFLRTENLTTDQTPYLIIQNYPDTNTICARSEHFPANTQWCKVSVPFITNKNCTAVLLSLRRDDSTKFDNKIKGILWLDGFTLQSLMPSQQEFPANYK
jgi:tetratricopeptide (TPR) repeat protein